MKAHSRSDSHSHATQAMLAAKSVVVDGTVVQQLQNVEAHKRAQYEFLVILVCERKFVNKFVL